jgi:hypothetical protein
LGSLNITHQHHFRNSIDTSDIEEKFNGFEGELKTGFSGMQQAVDFSQNLPAPLQSIEKYQLFIMMPFLALMLSLQLWVVYATSQNIQNGSVDATDNVRILLESTSNVSLTSTRIQTTNDNMEQLSSEIWIAIQSYVSTVIQIVLAFLMTQARVMAAIINSQIALLEGLVNKQLRKAVGEVFETIFQKGFGAVKEQFLILVRKIDKIEGPVNDIKAKFPVENMNLPTSVSDNIPKMGGSFFGQFGNKR